MQEQRVVTFKPEEDRFHPFTTVRVILTPGGQISATELLLSRSLVAHGRDGMFARDIAKSFLHTIIPRGDHSATTDLVNEIEYHYPESTQTLLITRGRPEVPLPAVPTLGYQVFLGRRQLYEQVLSRRTLWLENLQGESGTLLRIAIQTKL